MTLQDILNNDPILNSVDFLGTDKNTDHSYISHFYEEEFAKYKDLHINILEIGMGTGGSLFLWKKFFRNSKIYGIDIQDKIHLRYKDKDITYFFEDAYTEDIVQKLPNFDIIIEDGPHTFESQKFVLENYIKKLNKNGILIIEDIYPEERIQQLKSILKSEDRSKLEILDLRNVKNRFDDILMIYRD
jgi:SAM-dependent methyltransferase